MGFAGYVSFCVQLYCVGFHCLSLHVLAYMAIFRCVGALLCWYSLSFTTCFGHNTIFQHPAALYCSMGFGGYVSFCVQLYCMLVFHCLSLHVSAIILYFSILLRCIVQWVWRLCFCLRAALLYAGFPLSFTTSFGHNTIFWHLAALYCSMGFGGYVSVCVQLYCMLVFHCLSLHVSA
jgi:hypothetical protein